MKYCKICLVTDCKMFSSLSINKAYSQLVQELCDYKLYVCYECKHLLIKYQEFRSKCMMALKVLSSIQVDHSKVTKKCIKDIDRQRHKLESKLSHSSMFICNSKEQIVLPEPNLNSDIKTEMDICNSNEQIGLPEPSLYSDIKTENDNIDESDINVDFDAGGLFYEEETRDTEYNKEILQPEHNLESDTKIRTDTNPDAFENDNTEANFEIDAEMQGKENPNEIFQLNHALNNLDTETKLEQKCIQNSKKTKECILLKIKTLKSIKKKQNLNEPSGYLSKKSSNYIMKLIQNYLTKDKQKSLQNLKKTKQSSPKKTETLKHITKKRNPENPLSYLGRKPSNYMMQLIQNYATVDVMTPSEAKNKILMRKESNNYKINPHKCELCYKGFTSESTYNNHMKLHSPDLGTEKCEFCHRLFRKRSKLSRHIEGSHKYKITCKHCPFVCSSLQQGKCHAATHKGDTFTCEQCGMTYRYSHSLVNHKRIKHPEFVCSHCGNMFASQVGLRSHKHRTHKQDSTELLGPKCEECDVQFATETAWKRHLVISSKHTVSNGCEECGESFLTADELKSHAKEHPGALARAHYVQLQKLRSKKPAVCKLCDKRLETNFEYNEHMKSAHPNTGAVKRFVRRQVKEDRQYICEVCGKVFNTFALLCYHANRHAGERPYGCDQCDKKYTTPSSLYQHKAKHHPGSGALKFECDVCKKDFHRKCLLKKHIMLLHLRVRPFKCDICNKLFRFRYEVRKHKEYVHFKKPWPKRNRTKRRNKEDKDAGESIE